MRLPLRLHWILLQHYNCEWTLSFFILKVVHCLYLCILSSWPGIGYRMSKSRGNWLQELSWSKDKKMYLMLKCFWLSGCFSSLSKGLLDFRGFVVVLNRDLINFHALPKSREYHKRKQLGGHVENTFVFFVNLQLKDEMDSLVQLQ